MENLKLYRVNLHFYSEYSTHYVVAEDSDKAYKIVREFLDLYSIGNSYQRSLKSVELLAEETRYPDCETRLFVTDLSKSDNKGPYVAPHEGYGKKMTGD